MWGSFIAFLHRHMQPPLELDCICLSNFVSKRNVALRSPKAQADFQCLTSLFCKCCQKATRAFFNASYLPVMSAASVSFQLSFFIFSFFNLSHMIPPRLPLFFPNAPRPPQHGNVLPDYSQVNRAQCRNEITAAGLSAPAMGPSVSRK